MAFCVLGLTDPLRCEHMPPMPQPALPLEGIDLPSDPTTFALICKQVPWSGDVWRTQVTVKVPTVEQVTASVASDEWRSYMHDFLPTLAGELTSAYLFGGGYDVIRAYRGVHKMALTHLREHERKG